MHKEEKPIITGKLDDGVDSATIFPKDLKNKDNKDLQAVLSEYHGYKELMQNLIESAAHELKSPVANLKLITMLIDNTKDINELNNYLGSIKSSIARLNSSIIGMVKIFQTLNQEIVEAEVLNIKKEIEDSKKLALAEAGLPKVEVQLNIPEEKTLKYPADYFRYIFKELFDNSIRYKNERQAHVISIDSEYQEDFLKIIFKDNGSGMDLKKYGRNLFKAFKRFSNNTQGSGTGLFLIKSMLEKNHGSIEVNSEPGMGSIFTLSFKPYN
jgi:signal transduction histidine kinase